MQDLGSNFSLHSHTKFKQLKDKMLSVLTAASGYLHMLVIEY
jgi:hypothetical protein